jgi:hypothetical protein
MSEGPSIDDYSAEFWRRAKVASNVLHLARLVRPQDEEVGTLYRYRLFELDGAECGEGSITRCSLSLARSSGLETAASCASST